MITSFLVTRQGDEGSCDISDDSLFRVTDIAVALRRAMRAITGGSWTAFRIEVDEEGRASAHFDYD